MIQIHNNHVDQIEKVLKRYLDETNDISDECDIEQCIKFISLAKRGYPDATSIQGTGHKS